MSLNRFVVEFVVRIEKKEIAKRKGVFMQTVKEFFKNDRFAALIGAEIVDVRPGRAKTKMEVKKHHLNAVDTVQGGALFTLADLAFALASNSRGMVAVAITTAISFFRPTKEGMLYAEAKEVSCSKSLGTYNVQVTNEQGETVASFQGTAFRKKEINGVSLSPADA